MRRQRSGFRSPGFTCAGSDPPRVGAQVFDHDAQARDQFAHIQHIPDLGHLVQHDRLVGQDASCQKRQGRILVSGRRDFPSERYSAFDDEFFHVGFGLLIGTSEF